MSKMWEYIKGSVFLRPISDLYHSFFNNDKGFSFRKVGAVFAMYAAFCVQQSIIDDHVKQFVVMSWEVFGAVCIGLVTIPDLIKYLNKTPDPTPTQDVVKQDDTNQNK